MYIYNALLFKLAFANFPIVRLFGFLSRDGSLPMARRTSSANLQRCAACNKQEESFLFDGHSMEVCVNIFSWAVDSFETTFIYINISFKTGHIKKLLIGLFSKGSFRNLKNMARRPGENWKQYTTNVKYLCLCFKFNLICVDTCPLVF